MANKLLLFTTLLIFDIYVTLFDPTPWTDPIVMIVETESETALRLRLSESSN